MLPATKKKKELYCKLNQEQPSHAVVLIKPSTLLKQRQ